MSVTRPVAAIKVGDRIRRDLGDLEPLMESIRANGALLQPIVIRPNGTLIAGARRLEAYKRLGRAHIEVDIRGDLDSVVAALVAERDENTCRVNFTPSETVALAERLEKLERPAARERQGTRTDLPQHHGDSPRSYGPTRDVVAKGVGMGEYKLRHAREVVKAADEGIPGAEEALQEMDATGKVEPAYNKVKAARKGLPAPEPKKMAAPPVDTQRGQEWALAAKRRTETLVGQCQSLPRALPDIRIEQAVLVATAEEIKGWNAAITEGIRALTAFRKRLNGG